jgi:hypothetical protein
MCTHRWRGAGGVRMRLVGLMPILRGSQLTDAVPLARAPEHHRTGCNRERGSANEKSHAPGR